MVGSRRSAEARDNQEMTRKSYARKYRVFTGYFLELKKLNSSYTFEIHKLCEGCSIHALIFCGHQILISFIFYPY